MVNIQNVQEFACQVLNRDLWSNQAVKEIVSAHFVFWQVRNTSLDNDIYLIFFRFTTIAMKGENICNFIMSLTSHTSPYLILGQAST